MSARSEAQRLLAEYLRQRGELGETELIFDRLSVRDLAGLATTAVGAAPAPVAAPPAPAALAPLAARAALPQLSSLAEARALALGCTRCGLAETRSHVVFGEGNEQAALLVIGETPGAEEDRTGNLFVGAAGQLLTLLLASVGIARADVYLCNVLKCRPPENRTPKPEEVEACSPFLRQQVERVAPRVILACGTFAAQTLLGTTASIGKLRGGSHLHAETPLVPTYHPAALLRNPAWVRSVWEDLQRVRSLLDQQ